MCVYPAGWVFYMEFLAVLIVYNLHTKTCVANLYIIMQLCKFSGENILKHWMLYEITKHKNNKYFVEYSYFYFVSNLSQGWNNI